MFIVTEYAALSIQYVHGDLCKHLRIDSGTDRMPIICVNTSKSTYTFTSVAHVWLLSCDLDTFCHTF